MSTEAVTWAMDDAPMLRTGKGRPDSTARHVLQVLAEHARADGSNAHPSILRIQYRTGYDETTVRRALQRLEQAGLIKNTGTVQGRTKWRLMMRLQRSEFDWAELEAEAEAKRRATAERVRRHRAKQRATDSDAVTETDSDAVTATPVTDFESVSNALKVRDVTDSESVRNTHEARYTGPSPAQTPEKPGPLTTSSNHQEPSTDPAVTPETAATPTPGDEQSSDPTPISAQTIVAEWLERCAKRPPSSVIGQVGKQTKALLDDGIHPDDIRRGIATWMTRGLHPSTIPAVVNEAMNAQPVPAGRPARQTYVDPAERGIF
ncbi:helix-turn-helix domain-containing protein [Streptomyces sp. NPDC052013]|uniref:helix-turn-helix domain-containing protein n=1 Tax=Streptomyces sp. NPDC052013 TaxID=3365679 RepID=UPI0037D4EA9D